MAPEYANTGLLNERSDVYSFGVLLLEAVTGRDPVDYGRPANEVSIYYHIMRGKAAHTSNRLFRCTDILHLCLVALLWLVYLFLFLKQQSLVTSES